VIQEEVRDVGGCGRRKLVVAGCVGSGGGEAGRVEGAVDAAAAAAAAHIARVGALFGAVDMWRGLFFTFGTERTLKKQRRKFVSTHVRNEKNKYFHYNTRCASKIAQHQNLRHSKFLHLNTVHGPKNDKKRWHKL
jgi:hypothetical protein